MCGISISCLLQHQLHVVTGLIHGTWHQGLPYMLLPRMGQDPHDVFKDVVAGVSEVQHSFPQVVHAHNAHATQCPANH